MDPGELGLLVLRLRKELEWTQETLSERSKVSQRTVVRVEAGDTNLRLTTITRLLRALGCEPTVVVRKGDDTLLEYRPPQAPPRLQDR